MRPRAKARYLRSLTREFNGREDEKTNEREGRLAGDSARTRSCLCACSLTVHVHARDVSGDGNGTIQIASWIHDADNPTWLANSNYF